LVASILYERPRNARLIRDYVDVVHPKARLEMHIRHQVIIQLQSWQPVVAANFTSKNVKSKIIPVPGEK
jgi:hypothetical protein